MFETVSSYAVVPILQILPQVNAYSIIIDTGVPTKPSKSNLPISPFEGSQIAFCRASMLYVVVDRSRNT